MNEIQISSNSLHKKLINKYFTQKNLDREHISHSPQGHYLPLVVFALKNALDYLEIKLQYEDNDT